MDGTTKVSPGCSDGAASTSFVHFEHASPLKEGLRVASWNVEGLSEIKQFEIIQMMQRRKVDIACLQETRIKQSPHYITDEGFLVILSGSASDGREYAGVGFIIAPWARHAVYGFLQLSSRIACVKLKVRNGKLALISAYAPHSGRPYDERQNFFTQLDCAYQRTSVNGPRIVFGDLNARLHDCLPGEEDVIGDFVFRTGRAAVELSSNRELLVELCTSHSLAVANTFLDTPQEGRVTYRNLGVPPMEAVTPGRFGQLDLLLMPQDELHRVKDVRSHRSEPLASQHFVVIAEVDGALPPRTTGSKRKRIDRAALKNPTVGNAFTASFLRALSSQDSTMAHGDVNALSDSIVDALQVAEDSIPRVAATSRRPWIRQGTLDLIDRRSTARVHANHHEEQRLHKQIRRAARDDRNAWLCELAGQGTWAATKQLRTSKAKKEGRLADENGQLVESTCRADTLAKYLETVQWAVRPATLVDKPSLFPPLPVRDDKFSMKELREGACALRDGKASGPDGQPVEYWKAILRSGDSEAAAWLLELCNSCWLQGIVPNAWHLHEVALVYKKGDPADCGNYRPICLLNAAYKIFAMILLRRLLEAGADDRMWTAQYGFRPKRGTEDALHCARRAVEFAWAHKNGAVHLLALDWRKAFDSINPEGLLHALRRFGMPEHFLKVIDSIYSDRVFNVRDCGVTSERRQQQAGICQGCPLSPFLFIALMTVLMHDAHSSLSANAKMEVDRGSLGDVLYADDTLLIGTQCVCVEELARAIERAGSQYGMSLHWGKTQALSVCTSQRLTGSDGKPIEDRGALVYLGGLISSDGRVDSELSRRIGLATAEFRNLRRLWNHSNLSRRQKVDFFHAYVVSKLKYGLATTWLVMSQQRRLDGFYARCLRRILGIPAAYVSRVSNANVLNEAGVKPLTTQLLHQQILLLGRVGREPEGSPMRRHTLVGSTARPQIGRYVRRVGRPRQDWTNMVLTEAARRAGDYSTMERALLNSSPHSAVAWRRMFDHAF